MDLYLAIPTMNQGLLTTALAAVSDVSQEDPRLLIHTNGIHLDWADSEFRYATEGFANLYSTQSPMNIGVVPALQRLYDMHREIGKPHDLIAYLHDDVLIQEVDWDAQVLEHFAANPRVGIVGFFGAKGLGDPDLYKKPYDYRQLARRDCYSNMRDAEVHGRRHLQPMQVATVDGFSMICRREFLDEINGWGWWPEHLPHHSYDNALCCMARRYKWQVWMYPIGCHHMGGQTSTRVDFKSDFGMAEGDIHLAGHTHLYNEFKDVLPFSI